MGSAPMSIHFHFVISATAVGATMLRAWAASAVFSEASDLLERSLALFMLLFLGMLLQLLHSFWEVSPCSHHLCYTNLTQPHLAISSKG